MDFGFHNCIARALLMHCSAEEGRQRSLQTNADQLSSCISSLDSRADKQRFLESHHVAFMIPKKFEFQGQRGDEVIKQNKIISPHRQHYLTLCFNIDSTDTRTRTAKSPSHRNGTKTRSASAASYLASHRVRRGMEDSGNC